ncbi:hypothetical protein HK098_005029 [Nowakowskiella sp. JEL0407]|nr:hypothetical protein HK098_005029 [Nowakowskiella sp. JEL0407]
MTMFAPFPQGLPYSQRKRGHPDDCDETDTFFQSKKRHCFDYYSNNFGFNNHQLNTDTNSQIPMRDSQYTCNPPPPNHSFTSFNGTFSSNSTPFALRVKRQRDDYAEPCRTNDDDPSEKLKKLRLDDSPTYDPRFTTTSTDPSELQVVPIRNRLPHQKQLIFDADVNFTRIQRVFIPEMGGYEPCKDVIVAPKVGKSPVSSFMESSVDRDWQFTFDESDIVKEENSFEWISPSRIEEIADDDANDDGKVEMECD